MAYELTTAGASNAPTEIADGGSRWNNRRVAEFNGSDVHYFLGASHMALLNTKVFTMYFALDFDMLTTARYVFDGRDVPNGEYFVLNVLTAGATTCSLRVLAKGAGTAQTLDSATITHNGGLPFRMYICLRSDGTDLSICINEIANETTNTGMMTTIGALTLVSDVVFGTRYTLAAANGWDGNLGGIFCDTSCHNDTKVGDMLAWLHSYFGDPNP